MIDKHLLEDRGYYVIKDFITPTECYNIRKEVFEWCLNLNIGLTEDPGTWNMKNTFDGPRYGMYQSIISQCPAFYKMRDMLKPIFEEIWETSDLICSIDGATFRPPYISRSNDWPHIDQTGPIKNIDSISDDGNCWQAQLVINNSESCFRCTPGSHRDEEIINNCSDVRGNWYKFKNHEIEEFSDKYGSEWQTHIYVPEGSVIIWNSRLIHSASYQTDLNLIPEFQILVEETPEIKEDFFYNWRCTFYICMRPKKHYSKRNLNTIKNAVLNGRCTNHWGTKTFPKFTRYAKQTKSPELLNILEDPSILAPNINEWSEEKKKMYNLL